jgi:hypothetical protein
MIQQSTRNVQDLCIFLINFVYVDYADFHVNLIIISLPFLFIAIQCF